MRQCAYSNCQKTFEPGRANQKYHSGKCRELAKNERYVVLRVRRDEVEAVSIFLAVLRGLRRGVTLHADTELRFIGEMASLLKNRVNRPAA